MSRIGRRPVVIPEQVSVEKVGNELRVKGPRGQLAERIHPAIAVEVEGGRVHFSRADDKKSTRALHGLARALVANMMTGVTRGFSRELEIEGVGYRAEADKQRLTLAIGFSHPVRMVIPEGVSVTVEANTRIRVQGADRQRVGQFAADVRRVRPPEPYKGKGIRYAGERIRRKVGKAGAA
jgi:large subunit ribosomal protein L6